jgi:transcription antitermination factor NusG
MPVSRKNWYVIYTKPRWEKKVYSLLIDKQIEAYCPLNRVRRKWSDRIKWVEEPLFKSYVFVKVTEESLSGVRLINGVVNFVYWLGRPAIVKNKEIETIRKFLNDYTEVWAEPITLQKDAKVIIRQGAFMDKEAKVVKVVNNKVRVLIESIGFSLVAVVARSNVEVVEKH